MIFEVDTIFMRQYLFYPIYGVWVVAERRIILIIWRRGQAAVSVSVPPPNWGLGLKKANSRMNFNDFLLITFHIVSHLNNSQHNAHG